jgi:hypothetical protein
MVIVNTRGTLQSISPTKKYNEIANRHLMHTFYSGTSVYVLNPFQTSPFAENGIAKRQSTFEMYCIGLFHSDMMDWSKAVFRPCRLRLFQKRFIKVTARHSSAQLYGVNKEKTPIGRPAVFVTAHLCAEEERSHNTVGAQHYMCESVLICFRVPVLLETSGSEDVCPGRVFVGAPECFAVEERRGYKASTIYIEFFPAVLP